MSRERSTERPRSRRDDDERQREEGESLELKYNNFIGRLRFHNWEKVSLLYF